jgi:hypothetical protein
MAAIRPCRAMTKSVPVIRKDAAATAGLLSDTFREFGASSRVWDRAGIIAALSTETPYQIVSEHFECKRLASELALLTYVSNNTTYRRCILAR